MPQPNPVNWFEIPAADLPRAKKFYESALSTELTDFEMGPAKMAMFPMEQGVSGAAGALVMTDGFPPSATGSLVYFTVPSIEETMPKITSAGGTELLPKMEIGEHGWIAHFQDSEGNRVALHEALPQG